ERCGERGHQSRHVSTFGNFDSRAVAGAAPLVVLLQLEPEAPDLLAHYRVDLGIVVDRPAEDLDADYGLLEFARAIGERGFHQIAQELAHARRLVKFRTFEGSRKRRA